VRKLADRAALHDLMARYSRGVDRRDYALVASVFAPDVYLKYGDLWEGTGIEKIIEFVRRVERFPVTMHFMGNQEITLRGDEADMETYCIAHHRHTRDGKALLLVLGIRYVDRLRRSGGQWRVAHRVMHIDWSREDEATQ